LEPFGDAARYTPASISALRMRVREIPVMREISGKECWAS
jgi:hypothetical protein